MSNLLNLSKKSNDILLDADIIVPEFETNGGNENVVEYTEPYRKPLMKIHEYMQNYGKDRSLPLLNGKDSLSNFLYLMLGTLD